MRRKQSLPTLDSIREMDRGLRGPSRTALMAAMGRALHREGPVPHILDDWLAADLAGPDGRAIVDGMRKRGTPERIRAFQAWTAARSRFVEDFVVRSVDDGITQYVLLGAGLDSFAYRRADLADQCTVFEVDHPLSQAWKRDRLDELGVTIPHNVVFASVDFETQALRDGLSEAGVDFGRRAVVSWIGVTMYLERTAIETTLNAIGGCMAGTRLVLSYDQPADVLDEQGRALLADVSGTAAQLGEPFISLLRSEEVERLLIDHGFDAVTHFGTPDAAKDYFPGSEIDMPDVQRLATASVR
jgi:methyltransferase (TIGR00027 family)